MHRWTATAHPGLEPVVSRELTRHGVDHRVEPGALTFSGSIDFGVSLCRQLHTPDRFLLQITRGTATTYGQFAALIRGAPWGTVLSRHSRITVHVNSSKSKLRHRDTIEKKANLAIRDAQRTLGVGSRQRRHDTQRVHVRINEDNVAVSIATDSAPLHQRGWRTASVRAPIRENLAASLLEIAGWSGDEPLLDPMCGGGTILIEAGLMANGAGPFVGKKLSATSWPSLKNHKWTSPPRGASSPWLHGSDREHSAVLAAEQNAQRAGVQLDLRQLDLTAVEAPAPTGLVVTNPPYGLRLGNSVGGVYAQLGRLLRGPLQGWRAVFLAPSPTLARKVDKRVAQVTHFKNGGVSVGVWVFES